MSDVDLLQQVRDGHHAGFTELYLRHHGVARRVAASYRYHRDPDDLVNEAFEKVFAALRRGSGPTGSFRAYLLVTLRRLAGERGDRRDEQPVDDVPEPVAAAARGPSLEAEERELINRAFESLPERSQAVLWYTAVEGRHPRELSGRLGMTANAVSALAYRAREQLRQAYLQAHLQTLARPQCEPHRSGLGAYVRGGQSRRDRQRTEGHVARCTSCRDLVAELNEVNRLLVRAVVPVFLAIPGQVLADGVAGAAAAGAAGGAGAGAAAGGGAAGGGAGGAAGAAGAVGTAAPGGGSAGAVKAVVGRAGEAVASGGDAARRLPGTLAWAKDALVPAAGGIAAAVAVVGGLVATSNLVFRHDPREQPDAVGSAHPPSSPALAPSTGPGAAPGTAAGAAAAEPCRSPSSATGEEETATATPPAPSSDSPSSSGSAAPTSPTSPAASAPVDTAGLSLRVPLFGDEPLPSLLGPGEEEQPAASVALEDPVCSIPPGDDRGELTVALAGVGLGTEAAPDQTTATTAAPLVDLAGAGLELTVELSEGALALDAALPVGCEVQDGGHVVRCLLDEEVLGSETNLDLELLGEQELATVTLRQGDQTLDVRSVELLRDLTLPETGPSATALPAGIPLPTPLGP